MDLSVSELKAAQNSTENVQRWNTACVTSRYRFVGTSLICPGLHAVNVCPLLLRIVIQILLTLDCWGNSVQTNNLRMPNLSLGPTCAAGHYAGP